MKEAVASNSNNMKSRVLVLSVSFLLYLLASCSRVGREEAVLKHLDSTGALPSTIFNYSLLYATDHTRENVYIFRVNNVRLLDWGTLISLSKPCLINDDDYQWVVARLKFANICSKESIGDVRVRLVSSSDSFLMLYFVKDLEGSVLLLVRNF